MNQLLIVNLVIFSFSLLGKKITVLVFYYNRLQIEKNSYAAYTCHNFEAQLIEYKKYFVSEYSIQKILKVLSLCAKLHSEMNGSGTN